MVKDLGRHLRENVCQTGEDPSDDPGVRVFIFFPSSRVKLLDVYEQTNKWPSAVVSCLLKSEEGRKFFCCEEIVWNSSQVPTTMKDMASQGDTGIPEALVATPSVSALCRV